MGTEIQYFTITDMMQFENAGFTHSSLLVRFVICADCDFPIGYHDLTTGIYFIDLECDLANGALIEKPEANISAAQ